MQQTNPVLADSQYPLPSEAQILLVTPEMASDWLSHRSYNRNRKVSKVIVGRYLEDMKAGRWKTTRQGLIFDTHGKIIDGQHRLSAVANGEVTVAFWVYPDESRDNFEVLDQGYKRVAAQMLAVPYSMHIASSARYLAALSDRDQWSMPRFSRVTNPEIYATVTMWPELTRLAELAANVRTATNIIASPHLAVLAQAARTEHGTPENFEVWKRGLMTGDNLTRTDPRLQLRNRFQRSGRMLTGSKNRDVVYNLITKAWNAFVEGREVSTLMWRATEGIVPVTGFDWVKFNADKENQA